jgi:uncharacterized lipoprotein YajG
MMKAVIMVALVMLLAACGRQPTEQDIAACNLVVLSNTEAMRDSLLANDITFNCFISKGYMWNHHEKSCEGQRLSMERCYMKDTFMNRYLYFKR